MKKKLFLSTVMLLSTLLLSACGASLSEIDTTNILPSVQETVNIEGNIVSQFGQFIVIQDNGYYYDDWHYQHHQYLVYDKDTYIIYLYDYAYSGVSISPYYCLNENNEPIISIFHN